MPTTRGQSSGNISTGDHYDGGQDPPVLLSIQPTLHYGDESILTRAPSKADGESLAALRSAPTLQAFRTAAQAVWGPWWVQYQNTPMSSAPDAKPFAYALWRIVAGLA